MIVLVKKTLPGRMEVDQIAKKVIVRQKAGIDYRFADWHPALAGGGRREKAGEFVDPRTAIALGQEVVEVPASKYASHNPLIGETPKPR